MVLATPVGKQRGFFRGFLLTIATVGFYAVFWNYKAHDELYKQFELARENRDEGVIWYILGLIFPPLIFAYLWVFAGNVAYIRERMRLPRRSTSGTFVGTLSVGLTAFLAGWFALAFGLALVETTAGSSTTDDLVGTVSSVFFVGFLALVVTAMVAYARLQNDINEIWRAYEGRLRVIKEAPPLGALVPLPPLGPHPSTWAEAIPRPPRVP